MNEFFARKFLTRVKVLLDRLDELFLCLSNDININLIIRQPPPNTPLLPDAIPLDFLPLLSPPLNSLHHSLLPRITQLTRFNTDNALSVESGLTRRAEVVDFSFRESVEEGEGGEVGDHPGVEIWDVGDGVEESADFEDVSVFGAESRSAETIVDVSLAAGAVVCRRD